MSRKLIKQTCAQWRSNIWLIIEMMIVATAVWYLTDMVFLQYGQRNLPNGYHIENVAVANPTEISGGPLYREAPEGSTKTEYQYSGLQSILNHLRNLPMVEAVGHGNNTMPYNYNFMGNSLRELDRGDSLFITGNMRIITPEMVDILMLDPIDGRSRADIRKALERGELIIERGAVNLSGNKEALNNVPATDLVGQGFFFGGDSARVFKVGGVVENTRRNDYEPAYRSEFFIPVMPYDSVIPGDIAVKVRPGQMGEFLDYFSSHRSEFQAGNISLAKFVTADALREANQREIREVQRNLLVILSFLLISIFLGILGTFWFRTQERTSEIAVRKVNGARNADILRRLMGEGILLLSVGVVLSIGLDWLLVHFELGDFSDYRSTFIPGYGVWQAYPWTLGITFVIMCCMVILGTWYPAWRAMSIDPAQALQDE